MADDQGFKIKGAASSDQAEAEATTEQKPAVSTTKDETASPMQEDKQEGNPEDKKDGEDGEEEEKLSSLEDGEASEVDDPAKRYRWFKCSCDPNQFSGHNYYFSHGDTGESRWTEPDEPYWLFNAEKQAADMEAGLQYPSKPEDDKPDPNYWGYDPKIHGAYDPNAPYAQYHNKKREEEAAATQHSAELPGIPGADAYTMAGTFNRFTGAFQSGDKSAERHNDYNKSGRQMGAFFDVDAAANSHDGRSLKEERRNEKLSKKQIKELAEKRRAKKEKKRMDFFKS